MKIIEYIPIGTAPVSYTHLDVYKRQAVDRTQPFWGNFYIQGRVWKENGIEAKQVIRRNEVTKEIIPEVWEAVYEQIQQAVQNGWLK